MKKTVLAILAGMVCAISFACISGGNDYSGSSGNVNHSGMSSEITSDGSGNWKLIVKRVEADYLGYDFFGIDYSAGLSYHNYHPDFRVILRGAPNKTLVYISDINSKKHIEKQTFGVNARGDASFSATVYNRKTVQLPLRVKVGVIRAALNVGRNECFVSWYGTDSDDLHEEFCGHNAGGDAYWSQSFFQPRYASILNEWRSKVRNTISDFSLVLQYQVAGDSSWTTVSRTRFSDLTHQSFQWVESSDGVQISKPKYYFLNGKIDGNFPAGTTLLIRIVAESVKNAAPTDLSYPLTGWESFGEKRVWSRKMTDTTFTAHDIEGEVHGSNDIPCHYIYINGFSGGLDSLYNLDSETGDLNWCPLQWMAVTIGEGRRPE